MVDEKKGWDAYEERSERDEMLLSENDVRAWLYKHRVKGKMMRPEDVINKELSLGRISREQAAYLILFISCSMDFLAMGYPELAKDIKVEVDVNLGISRSIGGFGNLVFWSNASPTMQYDMSDEQIEAIGSAAAEEDKPKEDKLKAIKKLMKI